jgi:hypothetical protein
MSCSGGKEAALPATTTTTQSTGTSATDAPIPPTTSPYDALPEPVRLVMDEPFTGDFDALIKRRAIRVAVTFNRTHYFIDQGQERGLTYEHIPESRGQGGKTPFRVLPTIARTDWMAPFRCVPSGDYLSSIPWLPGP